MRLRQTLRSNTSIIWAQTTSESRIQSKQRFFEKPQNGQYQQKHIHAINEQIKKNSYKSMSFTAIWLKATLLIIMIQQGRTLNSGSALPIMHFEPSNIETGSRVFVPANDQSTDNVLRASFAIVLQRLQLENRNDYKCFGGLRNVERNLINGIYQYISSAVSFNSSIPACSANHHHSRGAGLFTSVRLNYIIWSKTLWDSKQILSFFSTVIVSTGCPIADGTNGQAVSFCTKSIAHYNLDDMNYKLLLFINQIQHTPNSSPALIPSYSVQVKFLSNTQFEFKLTIKYFQFSSYVPQVLMIREDLFKTDKKKLIFTVIPDFQVTNTITPFSFKLTFPHFVSSSNIFVGIRGFFGRVYSFDIDPTTPPSTDLTGSSRTIGNLLNIFALAFYGYSETCPSHLTMSCQPCPQYCQTCHVWPAFHCAECAPNFMLSSDKLSCNCPFSILNDFCGDLNPYCKSAKVNESSGTVVCASCDISKGLILVGNDCQCKHGYFFDSPINSCQEICGDGFAINSECDDGNTISNDGCSSTCFLQSGFVFDYSTSPPSLKTEILLKYKVAKIIRHENENSAKIFLRPSNFQSLPFPVQKGQFEPISSQISFIVVISQSPYKEEVISSFNLLSIDQKNEMIIEFAFDSNIEGLQSQILLNYEKTQYKNQTQTLNFQLKGDNYALKVTQNAAAYKAIGNTMLAAIILNIICFFIGFLSFKFIGVETILTLQIVYFCQLLIFDISDWPSGFTFLKNLKYSSGFNEIFNFTEYGLFDTLSKKMNAMQIQKLLIENFNINFIILTVSFFLFVICSILRKNREIYTQENLREMKYQDSSKKEEAKIQDFRKKSQLLLEKLNKLNEITFSISNQISFWLILPLISAVSAQFLIPNNQFTFIDENSQNSIFIKARGQILLISLIMIFCVILNNFKNTWLSLTSHNKLLERPEELHYKQVLFVYLLVIGLIVCSFNCKKVGPVYFSGIALAVHIVFILALVKIKPYKQSLKVHTVTLFINNGVVLVFLIVINLLNYLEDLDEIFILGMGFLLTGVSGVVVFLTFVRFYYDLRYGKGLEDKILEEREKEKQRMELEKQMRLKNNEDKLQRDAQMKKTEKQRMRDRNCYLFQNQQKKEDQMNLLEWLENRHWDQKIKDKAYFESFDEKPLQYLRQHDHQKYKDLQNELANEKEKIRPKKQKQQNDPEYQRAVQRLRSEYNKKKGKVKK